MEHIRQFDWCYSQPDVYFVKENDLANSVTEKILRNKFHDPMISSDSEEERTNINWDEVFSKRNDFSRNNRVYVPCMPKFMQYPKISALTSYQHFQCIKVLCAENPHVLPQEFIPRATKADYKVYEEIKPIYEKEQKEFKEWAKTQWTTVHCIRALRPKPPIEFVYDARFKMRENEMRSYPKNFDMAAQIPLETKDDVIELIPTNDLKSVDIKMLPQIEIRNITKKLTIMNQCPVPEPCNRHPCRFVLPNEKSVSILPLTEVQRELAQFALDNNAHYVASENALKCLVELDRRWNVPVSVIPVIGPDGESYNVLVLGNEFCINRESPTMRTYRAFRHLLQHTLVPPSEKPKLHYKNLNDSAHENEPQNVLNEDTNISSDEEDEALCIADVDIEEDMETNENVKKDAKQSKINEQNKSNDDVEMGCYTCTCKDTMFERPPPRSFKKWQLRNKTSGENFDVIIHCSHKLRDKKGEVLLEPIPEYQIELGATAQSEEKLRSLALSLLLRRNATLINVRVDGATGEVALFESMSLEELRARHPAAGEGEALGGALHAALDQLRALLPGHYVLHHLPAHGANAILYASKAGAEGLALALEDTRQEDEAQQLKAPPTLLPTLLPHHKMKRTLPCAFTPHEKLVARASRRPPLRHRTPPRALQWPKKRRKKKKNN